MTPKSAQTTSPGQIADYYAWATFRMLESGDREWFAQLPGSQNEFDILARGQTRYW